jgi:hypothetical protein
MSEREDANLGGEYKLKPIYGEYNTISDEAMLHELSREAAIVERLVQSGSLPDRKRNVASAGNTPLHRAIIDGDLTAAMDLIREQKYLDDQNDFGDTPLHIAAARDVYPVQTALVDAGASRVLLNSRGDTPLHVACRAEQARCALVILWHAPPPLPEDYVDWMNEEGHRPVHLAVIAGNRSVLAVLRDAGADMNAPDGLYPPITPLRYAVVQLNLKIMRYLVEECDVKVQVKVKDDDEEDRCDYFKLLECVVDEVSRSAKELLNAAYNGRYVEKRVAPRSHLYNV